MNGVDDGARASRRLHARSGRRLLPRSRRDDPAPRPRVRGRAERGAVYGRIGLCNQEFGTLASWLVDVVNILTGNFDRPGGLMFGKPDRVVDGARCRTPHCADGVPSFGRWTSAGCAARPRCSARCRSSCLAEEIATPGDGQIKALVTDRRQPGDQRARRRRGSTTALAELECMISVDN